MAGTKGAVIRGALDAYEVVNGTAGHVLTSNGVGTMPTFQEPISAAGPPAVASTSFLVSGGQVTWDSGFTFRVSAAVYYIDGLRYESAEDTVTLEAADVTNPRIDVIAIDTSLAVVAVTGTAAAAPSEPSIDPGSQLKLAIVSVPASSTQPTAAATQLLYAENAGHATEWNATSSGASVVVNSTSNPRGGTTDIEGTNVVAGVYAQLEKGGGGSVDPNTFDFLRFFLRSKATWNNNRGLQIILLSSGVQKGIAVALRRSGTYGFASSNTSDYQQIAIPTGDFQVPQGTTINQVRIQDFGGAIGFYIDDIDLQVVGGTSTVVGGITALTGDVTAGPGSGSQAATIANDAVTYAKMQNVSATSRILGRKTSGAGDTEECTLSEVLDFIGSTAQGDILYRGASGWSRLGAGTVGQFLKTNGSSANPEWADAAGGGGHLHGLMRILGDGATTTFNLLDFAEYLEHVGVNGAFVDPATFTLSADRSQITFDAAPGDGQVVTMEYVIAGL